MKKTKEEILQALTDLLGEGAMSDEAIALTEDIADTVGEPGEDWEQKYKDLDKSWRQKYHDRFFSSPAEDEDPDPDPDPEPEKLTFESLFTTKKGN